MTLDDFFVLWPDRLKYILGKIKDGLPNAERP
jgi:hypothetical protein